MPDADIENVRCALKAWRRVCKDGQCGGFNDDLEEVTVALESLDRIEERLTVHQLSLFEATDAQR